MRILTKQDAAAKVGMHPESMMRLVRDPEYAHRGFPKPVRIGPNRIGFVESEIDAWIEDRIRERDEHGYQPKDVNPRENAARAAARATEVA